MNLDKAWEIVRDSYRMNDFTEDEIILYEEALNHILFESLELCEKDDQMWKTDVMAGAYNLASHYEKIGKDDLAIKYYTLSEKYGCGSARERIKNLEAHYCSD